MKQVETRFCTKNFTFWEISANEVGNLSFILSLNNSLFERDDNIIIAEVIFGFSQGKALVSSKY